MLVDLSKKLRELRRAEGLTQKELADKLSIGRVNYTRYENGTQWLQSPRFPSPPWDKAFPACRTPRGKHKTIKLPDNGITSLISSFFI